MTLEEIYNTEIKNYHNIKENYTKFLEKLNDTQRKELEQTVFRPFDQKTDKTTLIDFYIKLKYKLKTFSTYYSKKKEYYDTRTYAEYLADSFEVKG